MGRSSMAEVAEILVKKKILQTTKRANFGKALFQYIHSSKFVSGRIFVQHSGSVEILPKIPNINIPIYYSLSIKKEGLMYKSELIFFQHIFFQTYEKREVGRSSRDFFSLFN